MSVPPSSYSNPGAGLVGFIPQSIPGLMPVGVQAAVATQSSTIGTATSVVVAGGGPSKVTVARPMNRFPPRELESTAVRTEQSKIFVCFLPAKFSEDDLRQLFDKFGKVRSVSYSEATHSGSLQFVSCFAASKAAKEMDNVNVGANRIQVKLAMRRTDALTDAEVGFTGSNGSVSSNGGPAPPAYNAVAPPLPPQPTASVSSGATGFVNTAPAYLGAPLTHLSPATTSNTTAHHPQQQGTPQIYLGNPGTAAPLQTNNNTTSTGTTAVQGPSAFGGGVSFTGSSSSATGTGGTGGVPSPLRQQQLDPCKMIRIQENGQLVNVVFIPTIPSEGHTTMYVTQGLDGTQQILATVTGTNLSATPVATPQQPPQPQPQQTVGGVSVAMLSQLTAFQPQQPQQQQPQQQSVQNRQQPQQALPNGMSPQQQQLLASQISYAQQQASQQMAGTQFSQQLQQQQEGSAGAPQQPQQTQTQLAPIPATQASQTPPTIVTGGVNSHTNDQVSLLRSIVAAQAAAGSQPNPQLQTALASAMSAVPQQPSSTLHPPPPAPQQQPQSLFGIPSASSSGVTVGGHQQEFTSSTGSQGSQCGQSRHPSFVLGGGVHSSSSTAALSGGGSPHVPLPAVAGQYSQQQLQQHQNQHPQQQPQLQKQVISPSVPQGHNQKMNEASGGTIAPAQKVLSAHSPEARKISSAELSVGSSKKTTTASNVVSTTTTTAAAQAEEENNRIQDMLKSLDDDEGFTSTC